ncbi:MAG TPA: hypothetical protein VK870_11930 [Ignavibacteriaceae bacterium]|nr:hypothetical protein [Ignavibacteriaceae bacterium]
MTDKNNPTQNNEDEKPPLFKSWKKLYIFVLVQLAALILLFYIFTKAFE